MQGFEPEINRIFKPIRKRQTGAFCLSVLTILLKLAILIQTQKAIDSISLQNLNITFRYLKNIAVLILIFFLINCIFQYLLRDLQYTSHYMIVKDLFERVLRKEYSFHEKYSSSVLLSMIKEDSKLISDWKSIGILVVCLNILTMAADFIIMLYYNVFVTFFVIAVTAICFFATHYISEFIGKATYNLQVSNSELNRRIIDYLNGFRVIKQYRKETYFKNTLSEYIDLNNYKISKSIAKYYSVFTSIYSVLTTALPVLVILVGIILVLRNQFTVGGVLAAYALSGSLQEPVLVIPDFFNQRKQALAMQEKILPILKEEPVLFTIDELEPLHSLAIDSKGYLFDNGKMILQDIHFAVKKGEFIIIKGESGSGKSSLFNLISRFYSTEEQQVSIKYNGEFVNKINPCHYYEHIIQASQTPYIFRDTVKNNIVLEENYTEEEINEAIYTACLETFFLTKGEAYLLEENGANISGGQRQRIGIARALLKKPDILLLDEPTSALNLELANTITERITQYCMKHDITMVVISHNNSFETYFQKIQIGFRILVVDGRQ